MDKETAVALAKLEALVKENTDDIKGQKEIISSWNSLVRSALLKIVTWLIIAGGTGLVFGWKMPPEVRKSIIEWVSK